MKDAKGRSRPHDPYDRQIIVGAHGTTLTWKRDRYDRALRVRVTSQYYLSDPGGIRARRWARLYGIAPTPAQAQALGSYAERMRGWALQHGAAA